MRPLLAALVLSAMLAPSVGAAWTSFHKDERNTGSEPSSSYQVFKEVWWSDRIKPNTQVEGSPVVAEDVAIVVGWDKKVRALDAESGSEKWNATFATKIVGTPVIASGRVFVVDNGGTLKAFDLQKGTELGTATVGQTLASPTTHEGKIFIGNEAGEMKAYDTETLTLLWRYSNAFTRGTTTVGSGTTATVACSTVPTDQIPAAPIRGAAAVHDRKVVFSSMNHFVYAIDEFGTPQKTTTLKWAFQTGDTIFASPTIDHVHNRVYIGSFDERVYAIDLDADSGVQTYAPSTTQCTTQQVNPVWVFCVPSTVGDSKVQSTVAVAGDRIFFGANNGRVYALPWDYYGPDPGIGQDCGQREPPLWSFPTGNAVVSSPAVANGILVVGSDDKKVYWLNATDGKKLKEFAANAPLKTSPAIVGQRAYIWSSEGDLYLFGPDLPPRPDLVVSSIKYDLATAGAVNVTVSNIGTGDAGSSVLRVFAGGSLLRDLTVDSLAKGTSRSFTLAHTLTPGQHDLKGVADVNKTVVESSESNNELVQRVTAQAPVPTTTFEGSTPGPTGEERKGIPGVGAASVVVLVAVAAALGLARRSRGK